MNCDTFLSLLTRWPDGELSPIEEKAMRDHAAQCPGCAQMLSAMEEMRRTLSHMDDEPAAPEDFARGWRDAVRSEAFRQKRRRVRNVWQSVTCVAAAFVLLLGGTALWRAGRLPIAYPGAPEARLQQEASAQDEALDGGQAADGSGGQTPQMARMAPFAAYDAAPGAGTAQDGADPSSARPEAAPAQAPARIFMTALAAFAGKILPWALGALAVALAGLYWIKRRRERK